ncbi:MAG: hypothetical protein PSX80_16765 [bacterium]|nr:hypothetical protein [bacterium]
MKKIIQIVSFLALVFVVAGTDVQAQRTTKIDANIPYDFAIGDDQFEAGKYVLRVRPSNSGASIAELRDSKHRVVYEGFILDSADTGNGKANLVFDRSGSVARLTQIRTGEKGFALNDKPGSDRSVNLASKKKDKDRETKN